MDGAFPEGALAAFSGYAAVDALYEGRSCVLSAVDNRQDKRRLYEVRDHDPSHDDIAAFLGRLQRAFAERALDLTGITTDGSARSPEPIRTVCGDVPHQLCTFHVIKALTKGVVKALAKARERLATSTPTVQRGRASSKDKKARRLARTSPSMHQKIRDLFQERLVCVTRRLSGSERTRLVHITRGLPPLRQRRDIMDHMYALCDRRCRTQTARGKRTKLRSWVNRCTWIGETFKKVFAPT